MHEDVNFTSEVDTWGGHCQKTKLQDKLHCCPSTVVFSTTLHTSECSVKCEDDLFVVKKPPLHYNADDAEKDMGTTHMLARAAI